MTTFAFDLVPHDPVLFGDNRSARAGFDHLQRDQDPSPVMLHGAIGQYLVDALGGWKGKAQQVLGRRVDDILDPGGEEVATLLGACTVDPDGGLWFPRPLCLRCFSRLGGVEPGEMLSPSDPGDARTSAAYERLLLHEVRDKELEGELLVNEALLGAVLTGSPLSQTGLEVRPSSDLHLAEPRAGTAIEGATGRVREGMLFTRPYRRFRSVVPGNRLGAGLRAWIEFPGPEEPPKEALEGRAYLGGDRRRAEIRGLSDPSPLQTLRTQVQRATEFTQGFFAYLLTSAVADGNWRLAGQTPVAAAVGRARYASGWNRFLNAPRRLEALVPAGSVFYYEWPGSEGRESLVSDAWLAHVGHRGFAAGYGRVLIGVWGRS